MELCKEDEYSLTFYEVAKQLMDLLLSGYLLEDGIRALADGIPPVEDLPFVLKWIDDDPMEVDKQTLIQHAVTVHEFNFKGPDDKMAKRILSKKASIDEWKLYTLRYVNAICNTDDKLTNFKKFFEDVTRAEMQCSELRKNTKKVVVDGDTFTMMRPIFPPWTDVVIWDEDWYGRCFGDYFCQDTVVSTEMKSRTADISAQVAGHVFGSVDVARDLDQMDSQLLARN